MRRLAALSLFAAIACARAPAEPTEPAPASAPVFVETQPLHCDDGLLALIGEQRIEIAEFDRIYALKQRKYADRGREIPDSAARRYQQSISERLIYQELLAREAAKLGVDDDPAALAERAERQRSGINDWDKHLRRRGEDDASLAAMYVAELRERAILERTGALTITEEQLREQYELVKDEFVSDAPRVRAAHILIEIDERGEAAAKARAEAVYQLAIQPDADFAALAREHSQDSLAREGGELGIFTADRMIEEFSTPVFRLSPGEVSKPLKTKFGYHVVKVYGAWGPGELPFEALAGPLRAQLEQEALRAGRRELKERLFAEYAPQNCVEQRAIASGQTWEPPREGPASDSD